MSSAAFGVTHPQLRRIRRKNGNLESTRRCRINPARAGHDLGRLDGAIAAAKEIINQRAGLAEPADLTATQKKFFEALKWPETQARVASLMQRGLQQRTDFELRLGHHLGAR